MSRAILVTGGGGLVGRNLVRRLEADGHDVVATGSERDLRDSDTAHKLLAEVRPSVVYHLAGRVGGIYANSTQKPMFYRDNILMNTHVVDAAVASGVEYVFTMGSSCAYPKRLEGSLLKEEDYLDGVPEPTNDAYAYAKRAMLVHLGALSEHGLLKYCYCLPANLYGPNDNFHPEHSHVIPALVRRFVEAHEDGVDEVAIWGDGSARRDFMYIEDCVEAMVQLESARFEGPVNVATGTQASIAELAQATSDAVGYQGSITYDRTKPSGQTERRVDIGKVTSIGWRPKYSLAEGLRETVEWFRSHRAEIRET